MLYLNIDVEVFSFSPSFVLVLYDGGGRLITALSTTSVTSLISCILADEEITIDIRIPF